MKKEKKAVEPEAAKKKEETKEAKVGKFTRGDHMVHVLLQCGRKFVSISDDQTINLQVEVQVGSQKQYFEAKADVPEESDDAVTWNDHLYFTLQDLTPQAAEETMVTIRALNKGFFRNELIGEMSMPLSVIYFQEKHMIEHAWLALENSESEDLSKIFGLLKASVACRGQADEEYKLEPQPANQDTGVLFMTAQTKRKMQQLKISIVQAVDLPVFGDAIKNAKEVFSANFFNAIQGKHTCEPFFKCGYAKGAPVQTTPMQDYNQKNTSISQTLLIPVCVPVINDRVIVEAWDDNEVGANFIGAIPFSFADITARTLEAKQNGKNGFFTWKDIYGADACSFSSEAMAMNNHPETGNHYKGRVLFYFELDEVEKPQKKSVDLDTKIKQECRKLKITEKHEFHLMADIGQGIGMAENHPYQVKIKIRSYELISAKPKMIKDNYCYWNQRLQSPSIELTVDPSTGRVDKDEQIFFYLMNGDEIVAWHREPLAKFRKEAASWKWFNFQRDTITNEIEHDYMCGMVNIRLSFVRKNVDLKSIPCWKEDPFPEHFKYKEQTIRCYIFQCRGLPPADQDGASDPFIRIVNHCGRDAETPVIEDNLNPIFMCTKTVKLQVRNDMVYTEYPPIVMNIFDADEGFLTKSADYLGRSVIFLSDAAMNISPNAIPPDPQWHKVKYGVHENSPDCGEILLSFSVFNHEDYKSNPLKPEDKNKEALLPETSVNLQQKIKTKEMTININLLGLRGLKSSGLLPVKKAFVKMSVRSMLPPEESIAYEDKIIPGEENGPDPNFCAHFELNLNLPIERKYMPSMSCSVMDQVLMGFSQPIVGTFQLPIGDIMCEQKSEQHIWKIKAKRVLDALNEILAGEKVNPDKFEDLFVEIEEENSFASSHHECPQNLDDQKEGAKKPDIGPIHLAINAHHKVKELGPIGPDDVNVLAPHDHEAIGLLSGRSRQQTARQQKTNQTANLLSKINTGVIQEIKPEMTKAEKTKAEKENFKLKEKQKVEEIEKKKKEADDMVKKEGWTNDEIVQIPEYERDSQLNCYRELPNKYPQLFKAVGFNSEPLIVKLEDYRKKMVAAQDDKVKFDYDAKRLATTKAHYRRYYNDELENVKSIFPPNQEPFLHYDIMAGQTRGASSGRGFLGFGSKAKETEDGAASTLKTVGTFKGIIKIFNKEEQDKFEAVKKKMIDQITSVLNAIYKKNAVVEDKQFRPELDFKLEQLETAQGRDLIDTIFKDIGCNFSDLLPFLTQLSQEKKFEKAMHVQTDAIVSLYVLGAANLASRDIGSDSDPYFTVKCGTFEFSNRDRYKLDNSSPVWNEYVCFPVNLPGSKTLVISAYDYDDLFGDDLIGTTEIDLDDRWFTPNWAQLEEKPIENRQVHHPSTLLSQGTIEMWLDINPASMANSAAGKVWDIAAEPDQEFEVRVVIFGLKGCPEADVEGTTDAYVTAFFNRNDVQETDTHYRCTNGEPNFNYRLKFIRKTPNPKGREILTLQCWDRDLIKSNDMLCQWCLDLTEMINDAKLTNDQIGIEQKYFEQSLEKRMYPEQKEETKDGAKKKKDSHKITFVKKPEVGVEGRVFELKQQGQGEFSKNEISIHLDIRVIPIGKAKLNPVGLARDQPNIEPTLPEPKGRFQFSLNPIAMLNQMCSPKVRRKMWCYGCCIFCVIFCLVFGVYMMPFIASIIQLGQSFVKK